MVAQRHHRNAFPKTAHPAEGWQRMCSPGGLWHALPGCGPWGAAFRRCRFAQPSATFRDASGIGSSPAAGSSRFFRCVSHGHRGFCAGERRCHSRIGPGALGARSPMGVRGRGGIFSVGFKRPSHASACSEGRLAPGSRERMLGDGGQSWIRTSEGVSQRIYSPPRLATSVSTRFR